MNAQTTSLVAFSQHITCGNTEITSASKNIEMDQSKRNLFGSVKWWQHHTRFGYYCTETDLVQGTKIYTKQYTKIMPILVPSNIKGTMKALIKISAS